jgi:selenocysteine lyase/cysteine desulfurase
MALSSSGGPRAALRDWAAVRAAFPGAGEAVYLNTGTVGLRARPVVEHLVAATTRLETGGQAAYPDLVAEVERARAGLAALLGAEPEEVGLGGNATDAVNWVAAGLDWSPGDEVLLSSQEHPAMLWPWTYLQQRRGVRLRRFEVSHDPQRCLAAITALLTPRTRLLATSHVSSETGLRVPVGAITALARERGLLTLVDGAQAAGNIPVDVRELGCDFYAGNGHKWLCGPSGTGFLWARPERMATLKPAHVGAGSARAFDPARGLTLHRGGRRFEYGTRDYARWAGLSTALDWLRSLGGVAATAGRAASLAAQLRSAIAERADWTLHTPRAWEHSSALTTFSAAGRDARELHEALEREQPRIYTRVVPQFNALRISTHYYNDESDLEALLRALGGLT